MEREANNKRRWRIKKGYGLRLVIICLLILTAMAFLIKLILGDKVFETPAHAGIVFDDERLNALDAAATPDWVDVQLISKSGTARTGLPLDEVTGIVIHYVANPGTTAQQNRNYFNNKGTEVCSHFVVGLDGEVIQCLPLYERSVSSNSRNGDTISIEVCHPDETGKFSAKTYDAAVKLTAWLCDILGFNEENIIRHYDINEKPCPLYYVENEDAWLQFKQDVMAQKGE